MASNASTVGYEPLPKRHQQSLVSSRFLASEFGALSAFSPAPPLPELNRCELLRHTLDSKGTVLCVLLTNLPYLLVPGVTPPRSNCIYAWVHIDDDTFRSLTVNSYDLRSSSGCSRCRYQTTAVRLDDLSRLGEILLGVTFRIGHINFPDEVDWRLCLSA